MDEKEKEKKCSIGHDLFDSNLIRQTNRKLYNFKVIRCGDDYIQTYNYSEFKSKKTNLVNFL